MPPRLARSSAPLRAIQMERLCTITVIPGRRIVPFLCQAGGECRSVRSMTSSAAAGSECGEAGRRASEPGRGVLLGFLALDLGEGLAHPRLVATRIGSIVAGVRFDAEH